MKNRIFTLFLFLTFGLAGTSYSQNFPSLDKSVLDVAYFPDNFAHDRKAGEKAVAKVTYSRPALNGREVVKLTPYGKVWRTGANESAEIKFYQDVELAGKKVKAGTYSLFTIPGEKEWTIILSNDLDVWGAYSYNAKNDVLRVTAPVSSLSQTVENFAIKFDKSGDKGGVMQLAWANTVVKVPFKY